MKEVLFNTHDLVLLFTIFLCLAFTVFLFFLKKGKKLSNFLLASFLITQAAIPLDNLINFGEAFKNFALNISPNLFYTFGLAYWIEASLLLFYVRSLIYKDFTLTKKDLWYLLPFLAYTIYFTFDWLLLDHQLKMAALQGNIIATSPMIDRIIHIVRGCLRCALGILCLIELHKYDKHIKNEVAELVSVDLTWLKVLVIGFLIIRVDAIFVALAIIFSYEMGINIDHEILGLTANYAILLLIIGLIFFSAGHSPLFKGIDNKLDKEKSKVDESFDPDEIKAIELYMKQSKPYLNHLLTLDNLANQVSLTPRYLSSLINRHFEKNFFEFINYYRVEESKALLISEENKKTTMLDVMDRAGFNSKATFNTFFKKLMGITPTQYRKNYWNKTQ
ncbi:MAG: helix-turn-helix domain-containing protein [Colwellia sp.]